jgi:hypothetical protein
MISSQGFNFYQEKIPHGLTAKDFQHAARSHPLPFSLEEKWTVVKFFYGVFFLKISIPKKNKQ